MAHNMRSLGSLVLLLAAAILPCVSTLAAASGEEGRQPCQPLTGGLLQRRQRSGTVMVASADAAVMATLGRR